VLVIDSSYNLYAIVVKILKIAILEKSTTDKNYNPLPLAKLYSFFDAIISLAKRIIDSKLLVEI
jgi:hypothetical protein